MTRTACHGEIAYGFAQCAIYWMNVEMKSQCHSLRSVPGGRQLFVMLPPVCNSDGTEVEIVAAAGRDGPDKGVWENGAQEQDLGHSAEGATREAA